MSRPFPRTIQFRRHLDSSVSTISSAIEESYKVGLSLSASGGFLDFAKATLKDTASWEWTNKSSLATSTGSSQAATVTVGGPAYGYSGSTLMQVYLDNVYHTFAFALLPTESQQIAVSGTLVTMEGAPLKATEVSLVENGITHRTFTNAKGEYRFLGNISGPVIVKSAGVSETAAQPPTTTRHILLRKP
jgi:hypothetical protein